MNDHNELVLLLKKTRRNYPNETELIRALEKALAELEERKN
jgi:hypothetical protein